MLKDPQAKWDHVSVTYLDNPGSFGLSADGWRYIRYKTGDEELYHIATDPHEWTNLAGKPGHQEKLATLRKLVPTSFAPAAQFNELVMEKPGKDVPVPRPEGLPAAIRLVNALAMPVRVHWIGPTGERKKLAAVMQNAHFDQNIRKGDVWLITDADNKPVGYFIGTGEPSRAVIRK